MVGLRKRNWAGLRSRAVRASALAAAAAVLVGPVDRVALQAGPLLTFDLGLRVESDSNVDLTATRKAPRHGAQLRFGLGLVSETEISKLAFSANGALAAYGGRGARGDGLVTPALQLRYDRGVADADLNLRLGWSETDLDRLDPDALDLASGGRRRLGEIGGAITWGKTAPLGFGLRASSEVARYIDAPGQTDYRTDRVGASLRADLTEALTLDLDLSHQIYRPEGRRDRRSTSARLGLTLARPTGSLTAGIGLDDTPEGGRQRLNFGQVIDQPLGQIAWTLGAVRDSRGRVRATGDLSWERALPEGAFGVKLSRDVTSSTTTDRETLQNRLAVNFRRQLTQTGGLQVGASWSESRYSDTGTKITGTQISASWYQELTRDWALDLGYAHRSRETEFAPRTRSDMVYLELRRSFEMRF